MGGAGKQMAFSQMARCHTYYASDDTTCSHPGAVSNSFDFQHDDCEQIPRQCIEWMGYRYPTFLPWIIHTSTACQLSTAGCTACSVWCALWCSVRTSNWRYTEWVRFNGAKLSPDFAVLNATELYQHSGPDTSDFGASENENVANDPHNAATKAKLSAALRARFAWTSEYHALVLQSAASVCEFLYDRSKLNGVMSKLCLKLTVLSLVGLYARS